MKKVLALAVTLALGGCAALPLVGAGTVGYVIGHNDDQR